LKLTHAKEILRDTELSSIKYFFASKTNFLSFLK